VKINLGEVTGDLVSFTCASGAASGIWRGNALYAALPGASFDIEFTLSRATMELTAEREYSLRSDGGRVTLVGQIESVDPDGIGFFRMGGLTIVTTPFPAGAWISIQLAERDLEICPYERL
jgi:hypothetical protein